MAPLNEMPTVRGFPDGNALGPTGRGELGGAVIQLCSPRPEVSRCRDGAGAGCNCFQTSGRGQLKVKPLNAI